MGEIWWENLLKSSYFEDRKEDGNIILKLIFGEYFMLM
jgi:hypothetical protein